MDQIKIGKFIARRRKEKDLTQLQLADKLGVTDRAVSKWECGRSLPDSSIMIDLCDTLGISVNELLSGEEIDMKDYSQQAEQNLLELKKIKEETDKRLLRMEIVMGVSGFVFFFTLIMLAALLTMETWLRIVLIAGGVVVFLTLCLFALRIEQKAGYYECAECHHRYVPSFASVLFAPHMGRARQMKCPRCGKRSWQKKVISDHEEK